ncbi:MAG: hypothetical protein HY076_03640 [Candidatus Eisenbacteria bacterium]|uniref:FlgD/Vpr Ig-like domain-containing protein n=1 Tax=Eiseniibacteriota bacterium TaxID=2212470 RepID=A0A9D6QIG9_UNCEI|nr:hypothetical protein [Candidatus Eisenbacteria bacterium]MBI3539347.1 hypothetical protein [Candidatus Eisenbacteria bacterium]
MHRVIRAAVCAAAIGAGALLAAHTAHAGVDLWVDPAGVVPIRYETLNTDQYPCAYAESCLAQLGVRRVMRFGNAIVNRGNTDLVIGVAPPDGDSDSLFHWDTCHQHHHLKQIMEYELLDATGTVAVGRKINFCMADTRPWAPNAPPSTHFCNGLQGLTAGWADVYGSGLDCQWLDITGLPNGTYTLRLTVDPLNAYAEDDENNNVTTRVVVLGDPVSVEQDTAASKPSLHTVAMRPDWGAEAVTFTVGADAGRATLSVYDVTGRERRTLFDSEEAVGASEYVPWRGLDQSGRHLPSGVYYVRLKLPNTILTRAVLIVRTSQ